MSPGIGPTTRMLLFESLYGDITTPSVAFFNSSLILSLGASLKPSGSITTAPTLRGPLVPSPVTCLDDRSYGISTTASKTVSGRTP